MSTTRFVTKKFFFGAIIFHFATTVGIGNIIVVEILRFFFSTKTKLIERHSDTDGKQIIGRYFVVRKVFKGGCSG